VEIVVISQQQKAISLKFLRLSVFIYRRQRSWSACIGTDKYHAELDVISHVTTYYDISSKRLIDDISQVFETIFAKDFGLDIGKCLTKTLNLVGPRGVENCERYIQDESDVHAKREGLLRQRGILDNILATLDKSFK
jgi:hypothetical protein